MPDDPGEALDWAPQQHPVVRLVAQEPGMDVRPWLAMRVEQWKRVAPMAGLGIQGMTLAGVVYGLVAWRGVHPAAIGALFLAVVALAFLGAWFYYGVLGMRPAEQQARFFMDLRDQDMLSPKEAALLGLAVRAARGDRDALATLESAAKRGRL